MSAARVHSIAEFDDWLRRGERFLTDEIVEEAVRSSCPEWGVLAPALPVLRDMLVAEIGDYATVRRGARAPETYKHMRLLIEAARS